MNKRGAARWGVGGIVLALLALVVSARLAPAQVPGDPSSAPVGRIRHLLSVGDSIVGPNRTFGLGFFRQESGGVSRIRGVSEDGSLFLTDYAGVSLLRFQVPRTQGAATASQGSGAPEILLDSTKRDPGDDVGLARIIRVATNRHGTIGVIALRADSTYGVYRLQQGVLVRLALLPDDQSPIELSISDAGQIDYIAPNDARTHSLFQVPVDGPAVPIVSPGQRSTSGLVVVDVLGELAANDAGDLAFLAWVRRPNGAAMIGVCRKRGNELEVVAKPGDIVAWGRGSSVTGPLQWLSYPRIGPEGTVVFRGDAYDPSKGRNYSNIFAQGPGRSLQPLLPGENWIPSDYAIDSHGSIAVMAQPQPPDWPMAFVYLIAPTGEVSVIVDENRGIAPWSGIEGGDVDFGGAFTFDARGNLFFPARRWDLPPDRYGLSPVRLIQYRPGASPSTGTLQEVEVSRAVPSKTGLLGITQSPVLSADGVALGALFGGSQRFAVPTGGLLRVPYGNSSTERGTLVAVEADALAGADRIGIPQRLYYTSDGSLVADVVLPGGGAAAITLRSGAGTATVERTQSVRSSSLVPLLATGQPLGRPDRTLLSFFGDLVPLGVDQQLVTARYSQAGQVGEGLFAVGRTQIAQLLADTLRAGSNTRLTSFSNWLGGVSGAPSVSPEGNIVFEAGEDRGGGSPERAVFQWLRSNGAVVRMFAPRPPREVATRWLAGPGGIAYVLTVVRWDQERGCEVKQLVKCFQQPGTQLVQAEPLVIPGTTPLIVGGSEAKLSYLDGFIVDGGGEIFVSGSAKPTQCGVPMSVFYLDANKRRLETLVTEGDPLPPFPDGSKPGGRFLRVDRLLPDSAHGPLLFRALVFDGKQSRRGLFRRNAQGRLETVLVEGLGLPGSRDVAIWTLSDESEQQNANSTTAFASKDQNGRWTVYRSRPARDSKGNTLLETTLIAREGEQREDGYRFRTLNAGPLVGFPGARQGPIFALNNAGDVAFFASDGQRWGVYEFSDRP